MILDMIFKIVCFLCFLFSMIMWLKTSELAFLMFALIFHTSRIGLYP